MHTAVLLLPEHTGRERNCREFAQILKGKRKYGSHRRDNGAILAKRQDGKKADYVGVNNNFFSSSSALM